MKRQPHKQVWVKVNAPVDEGVVGLIESLSSFSKLQTFESCQGGYSRSASDEEGMQSVVFFDYGREDHAHSYREIADFVLGYLGPGLMKELGDRVSIGLEVTAEHTIMATLKVRQGAMERTVQTLKRLRRQFGG